MHAQKQVTNALPAKKHQITQVMFKLLAEQSETLRREIGRVRDPLEDAFQSARVQERMIKAMIDDFRIQTNTLELRMEPTDLRAIVQEAVADWQRQRPERTILLAEMLLFLTRNVHKPRHTKLVGKHAKHVTPRSFL
jgi:signal transduction histidine kinase